MGQRISIAKAAKILGIDRHELCDRICHAGFDGFEGGVDVDDLKSISPNFNTEDVRLSERTRLIRQTARRRQAVQPPRKKEYELQDDLDKMHNKWLFERKKAQEYSVLFDALVNELGHWQASPDPNKSKFAIEFSHWICDQLDE